jgi:hypothetical protein
VDERPEYEGKRLFMGIGVGIAVGAPLGTAAWISKHGIERIG